MTINLKIPDAMSELKPRITVFGVGGAGGNAVNNMIQEGLDGVEFVVANTDAQALAMSSADRRIQMGTNLTEGLGAGSQPKIGAAAAQEAQAEILDYSAGSHMVFITIMEILLLYDSWAMRKIQTPRSKFINQLLLIYLERALWIHLKG